MTNVRMAKKWFGNVTKQIAIAYIAFALCALATMVAWYLSRQDASKVPAKNFIKNCSRRAVQCTHVCKVTSKFCAVALDYSPHQSMLIARRWKRYVTSLNVQEAYPGIQGIGFAPLVAHDDKAVHVAVGLARGVHRLRQSSNQVIENFICRCSTANRFTGPEYAAHSAMTCFPNPVRRKALEQARDSGKATIVWARSTRSRKPKAKHPASLCICRYMRIIRRRRASIHGVRR